MDTKIDVENPENKEPYIEQNDEMSGGSCDLDGAQTPFDKGYYMAWWVDEKNPFEYFLNKYGRKPTEIGIGKKVQIDVPDGVKVLEMQVPEGQIWIR